MTPRLENRPAVRAAVAVFSLARTGLIAPPDVKKASSLEESQMPKLKTKSGAKKRFKLTGTGKVVYAQRRTQHGMKRRTAKQNGNLRGTSILFKTDGDKVKKFFLPNG